MEDLDDNSWDDRSDMPDMNSFKVREFMRVKQALKAERAARAKLEDAVREAGMTDHETVRGDGTTERTPLFQKVYSGRPISHDRLRQLIGTAPLPAYNRDGDRYPTETGPMPNDPLGKMPIPTWDGTDIATKIKPWLEDLKQWREFTVNSIPPKLAAWKLQMSLPDGSWMRRCANMIPREQIMSVHVWDLILKEIIYACKP